MIVRTVALLLLGACAAGLRTPDRSLSMEEVFRPPAALPSRIAFGPDGRRLAYVQRRAGTRILDLWVYDVVTGKRKLLYRAEGAEKLTAEEQAARERRRERGRGVTRFFWNPIDESLLLPMSGDLFVLDDGEARRLTKTPKPERDPTWSPNGRTIAFVREKNLYVLRGGKEKALTTEGKGKVRCGLAEFIASEELGRHRGYWWSRDSQRIAYVRTDSSNVPTFSMHRYLPVRGKAVEQEYPRAGDPNALWKLGVVSARGGETVWMKIRGEYLARVHWLEDGSLAAEVLDRSQRVLSMYRCDPETGVASLLFTETDDAWVGLHRNARFLKDGRVLWTSERSGRRHLYLFESGGFRALTSGDWDVASVASVDEKRGRVYFLAGRPTPRERQLFFVGLNGGEPRRLTVEPGWHAVTFAKNHRYWIDTHSRTHIPPRTVLRSMEGEELAVLGEQEAPPGLRPPEFLEVPGADGTPRHAAWMRARKPGPRPAVFYVYGGPASQTVADRWRGKTFLFHTRLTQLGFSVFWTDNRGTSGRGRDFVRSVSGGLCVKETEDQAAAARWLGRQRDVDASRIGIWGWSYGGTMTLSCLLDAPAEFRAGIAVAPVTDWRDYDTAYTERYMGVPKQNAVGYDAASPVTRAASLDRPVLLVHGFMDDNVHFRGAVAFLDAAQRAGKRVDQDFYPRGAHGIGGPKEQRLLYERMERFWIAELGK